jgi:hypothetical protein
MLHKFRSMRRPADGLPCHEWSLENCTGSAGNRKVHQLVLSSWSTFTLESFAVLGCSERSPPYASVTRSTQPLEKLDSSGQGMVSLTSWEMRSLVPDPPSDSPEASYGPGGQTLVGLSYHRSEAGTTVRRRRDRHPTLWGNREKHSRNREAYVRFRALLIVPRSF